MLISVLSALSSNNYTSEIVDSQKRTFYVSAGGGQPIILFYLTWLFIYHLSVFEQLLADAELSDTDSASLNTELAVKFVEYIEKAQQLCLTSRYRPSDHIKKEKKTMPGLNSIQKLTELQLFEVNYKY